MLDYGIGFGKTVEQNFALLGRQTELLTSGYPLLAGWSRKSSLAAVSSTSLEQVAQLDMADRMVPSVTAALLAVQRGASVVRVHDVRQTVQALKVQYFGTDGIRGTVGKPPITPDFVLRLAHAVGRVLKRTEARPTVLIGKDTRISGYMLESALESGFNSAGVDVVLLGPLPTPGVAYLTRAQRASLGVVISASHNAFPDNGIKFFSAQGAKLDDAWELAVEAALEEPPVWAESAAL
eukprot:gene57841-77190_t